MSQASSHHRNTADPSVDRPAGAVPGLPQRRRTPWVAAAALLLSALLPAPSRALTPDDENVAGLRELRDEVITSMRDGRLDTAGPWTLRYTGPLERGTVVNVYMQPTEAFSTFKKGPAEFKVKLKDKSKLLTKVVRELRPMGVRVMKTFEEPGEGRVYVTFQTKEGKDIPLARLEKLKMIKSLEWSETDAVEFLGYEGIEAGFRRRPGHEDTTVEVVLIVREEGHDFVYSAWLPRLGDTVPVAPRHCRQERLFTGARLVRLRSPWVGSGLATFQAGARSRAADAVWGEIQKHCEASLGGELIQDTVKLDYDAPEQDNCVVLRNCRASARATYQCKIRQYETAEICN